ncbi:Gfo/Idh/MocA family protein [Sphaerotilus mobilis]|uniref:Putative dehydrogenase n=1 Tax=Sphaerotilus mobilis TaxID=47994 RepID=A0A4Q7LC59_9BURK|nr:Gfo/Idh/MocA family oxidoreductase [Sphaerotilus mobilis]RZS51955.1 putative dehydrogenase [Sphaerotilus mobilis]
MTLTRIAVAGAGYIGQAHLDAVGQWPDRAVLSAIVDPSPAARAVAEARGVPLYASLDELIVRDRPDGIVLATPNALHVPQALSCLAAGLPILLEKPIAPTVAEAAVLVREVEARAARVLIGHHRAHSPIMAKAREVIAAGRLGRVVGLTGSATFYKPDAYFDAGPWRREKGGGPILLNLIHEVHNLRMLCGEIVAVQAFASHAVRGHVVEDTVAINLRFASGALGTFLLSDCAASPRSWEQTSAENKAYDHHPDEDCYVVSGTDGSLSVPTMRLKSYPGAEDRSWWKPLHSDTVETVREDPIRLQMAHYIEVVRGTTAPLVSARDGLNNLRITEAVVEAAASGRMVAVAQD